MESTTKIVLGAGIVVVAICGIYAFLKSDKKSKNKNLEFELLKFSDIIKLAKEFIKDENLENKKVVLLKSNNTEFVLTLYDTENNEIIGEKTILIKTKDIDESLKISFGNKEMLILE